MALRESSRTSDVDRTADRQCAGRPPEVGRAVRGRSPLGALVVALGGAALVALREARRELRARYGEARTAGRAREVRVSYAHHRPRVTVRSARRRGEVALPVRGLPPLA
jgi:hypothetical protein